MPVFAPVYRPTKHQQTFLSRQQKLENKPSKKRKRGADPASSDDEDVEPNNDDEAASRASSPSPEPPRIALHPVNKTDPYHIAGHSREEPLPLPPFPHAALKEPNGYGASWIELENSEARQTNRGKICLDDDPIVP